MTNPTLKTIAAVIFVAVLIWLGYTLGHKTNSITHSTHTTDTLRIKGKADTLYIYKTIPGVAVLKPVIRDSLISIDTTINDNFLWLKVSSKSAADSLRLDYTIKNLETQIYRVDTIKILDSVIIRERDPTNFYTGFSWGAVTGLITAATVILLTK